MLVDSVAATSTKVINTVVDKGQDLYNNATRSQAVTVASPEVFAEKTMNFARRLMPLVSVLQLR